MIFFSNRSAKRPKQKDSWPINWKHSRWDRLEKGTTLMIVGSPRVKYSTTKKVKIYTQNLKLTGSNWRQQKPTSSKSNTNVTNYLRIRMQLTWSNYRIKFTSLRKKMMTWKQNWSIILPTSIFSKAIISMHRLYLKEVDIQGSESLNFWISTMISQQSQWSSLIGLRSITTNYPCYKK